MHWTNITGKIKSDSQKTYQLIQARQNTQGPDNELPAEFLEKVYEAYQVFTP